MWRRTSASVALERDSYSGAAPMREGEEMGSGSAAMRRWAVCGGAFPEVGEEGGWAAVGVVVLVLAGRESSAGCGGGGGAEVGVEQGRWWAGPGVAGGLCGRGRRRAGGG